MMEKAKPSITATNIELRNRGIIYLSGEIEKATIDEVAKDLIYVNEIENPGFKAVQLIINSVGGQMSHGFLLVDLIEHSKMPVYVTGLGMCASIALLILCSGAKGHRVITKNTLLLSHQYSWTNKGKHHELVAGRKEQDIVHKRMVAHYRKHTKLRVPMIKKILLPPTDVWLTTAEALKYGIVDKVTR